MLMALLIIALALFIYLRIRKRTHASYPPGPNPLPILGNILQLPSGGFEWKEYDRMCKALDSDIMYLRAAGNDILILNSLEAANDLFDKRSSIYSNRSRFPMVVDMMGWGWLFSLVNYGDFWRERRRIFTKYFHTDNQAVYRLNHMKFIRGMLPELLDRPSDFMEITRSTIGGSSLAMAYGLSIKKRGDPYIDVAEKALSTFNEAIVPSKFLVNTIPALRFLPGFLPGLGFKKKAKVWSVYQEEVRNFPFERALRNILEGTATPSFISANLKYAVNMDAEKKKAHEEVIKDAAGMVFVGSVDTALAAMKTFYASMLLYPDAQKKAQKELDQVLAGRLPEFSDEIDLPFLTALIKEILRWNPIVPLGFPHTSNKEDIYRGYYIPEGTIAIVNAWSLLNDKKYFPNPSEFRPERFLEDGHLRKNIRDPMEIIFGFGRRICPGREIAWSFLWLAAATILSCFDILPETDDSGNTVQPHVEFHSSVVCEPLPFKCTIKPRSKEVESSVRDLEMSE